MANLTRKSLDDLRLMAIDKGFADADIADLSKAQLIELIEEADTNTGAEEKAGEVVEDIGKFKGDKIHVWEKTGEGDKYIRTYSKEDHGDAFKDNAKSFVGKRANRFLVK